ncbi:alpha/beta fold hydrolase [uncultured Ilumatobacter sp.]|uniref:alpha/beta fold hydrolase n=1 Tax=uncultured Ilumatobacter sp. TaxID=879968 RepID=UPI00374F3BD6
MGSVVLVHGWGGSFATTWQRSGLTALLEDGGKKVVGVDLLGHGAAPKPHDPEAYNDLTARVFDAIDAASPDEPIEAVGFSLGAITLLRAAIARPDRFSRLVLAGIGKNVIERDQEGATRIIEGLESVIESGEATPAVLADMDHTARLFVQYAQQPDNDIVALAAVMRRASASELDATLCSAVTCPVLIVVGDQDFVHPADELASWFPQGQCETLRNVDHFATPEAFGFFDATLEFLDAI